MEESIATTLANSKVIRQLGGFAVRGGQRTAPNNLLGARGPDIANTIYQPALQASSTVNFGGANGIPGVGIPGLGLSGITGTGDVGGGRAGIATQGVEDALSAYDAHFTRTVARPLETTAIGDDPAALKDALRPFALALDEVVVRAVAARESARDYLAVLHAAMGDG